MQVPVAANRSAHAVISRRGAKIVAEFDIPWRVVPGGSRYDAETNPDGFISFATAENLLVQSELEEFANKVHIPAASFGYGYSAAGGRDFPTALAAHLNEHFAPHEPVTAGQILCTASATALHEVLGFGLGDAGDGVLTTRPCYGRFELDFGNKAGLKMVYADTHAETCFDADVVVPKIEEALVRAAREGVTVRALLIVNPHNPLGRCYPRDTLIALMQFCQRHQIHLISDEVYGLSVFESGEPGTFPFTSALSIDNTGGRLLDERLLHVTYAMSKDFASPGLRVGALITRSAALQQVLRGVVRFCSPSGPALAIATAMLRDHEWCRGFVALSRARIAAAYKLVTAELGRMGVAYLPGSNAGLFIWIDLSPFLPSSAAEGEASSGGAARNQEREWRLAQRLFDAGVFLQPGEEHALSPGWFRLVYTFDEKVVKEGLRRIASVIQKPWP